MARISSILTVFGLRDSRDRRRGRLTFAVVLYFFLLTGGAISYAQERAAKAVIVFYSWSGDTERVVKILKEKTGSDTLCIRPSVPYPHDYMATLERAREEKKRLYDAGEYPPIHPTEKILEAYDTIIVCYPVWLGKMAFPMQSFLRIHADTFAGKDIALITLSGKSPGEKTLPDAGRLCPGSRVLGLLSIKRADKEGEPRMIDLFITRVLHK